MLRRKNNAYRKGRTIPSWLRWSWFGLHLLIGGIAPWVYHFQKESYDNQVRQTLLSIATLKARQISAWYQDQVEDAELLAENSLLHQLLKDYQGQPSPKNRQGLKEFLAFFAKNNDITNIHLLSLEGQPWLSIQASPAPHPSYQKALKEAFQKRKPMVLEPYKEALSQNTFFEMLAPISMEPEESPTVALSLITILNQALDTVIYPWPIPAKTAKTYLVQRKNKAFKGIYPLKPSAATPWFFPIPLPSSGYFEGKDERGEVVEGMVFPIASSPWFLVVQQDKVELYKPWKRQVYTMILYVIILTLAITAFGMLLWQRNQKAHYAALYRAEMAMRQMEKKHQVIVESIDDGVITTDPFGKITYMNPMAERLTGWKQEKVMGKPITSIIPLVKGKTRPPQENVLEEVLRAIPHWTELQSRDDKIYPISASAFQIFGEENKPLGLVITFQDMTEQLEKDKLQAQFYQAQKMEAVGRLAGGIAHDFNNMLGAILGYTELALEEVEKTHPLHDYLKEIHKIVRRSADLTRQLLAFARKQPILPKPLNLNHTVEHTMKMLKRLIGEDIRLLFQQDPQVWLVRMDPNQVVQILANLCINARDAISGMGTIIIATKNVVIDETWQTRYPFLEPGEYVRLSVQDDGRGIAPEILPKIFEPFFTTKGEGKGTGLGLATVYGMVKQNEGYILVDSQVGEGTTISIYIPRFVGEVEEEEMMEGKIAPGKGETILLVEDEVELLNALSKMMRHLGYRVIAKATPQEALQAMETQGDAIDLLITDMVMPQMNGKELVKKIKNRYPDLPYLFISGYMGDSLTNHVILDPEDLYIQKPFSLEDLAQKIREVLEKS